MALKQQEVTSYTKNRGLISRAGARKRSPYTVLQRRDQHSECSRALARQNSIFTQQIFARSAEHASAIRSLWRDITALLQQEVMSFLVRAVWKLWPQEKSGIFVGRGSGIFKKECDEFTHN